MSDKNEPKVTSERTLFETEWISLKECLTDGEMPYHYAHEQKGEGEIVAVLPYRILRNNGVEYLLRKEHTPAWGDGYHWSALTGKADHGSPMESARAEVREEAGFDVPLSDLHYLGSSRSSKSSDTKNLLFTVNLTGKRKGEATTDGTDLEEFGSCHWKESVLLSEGPLPYVMKAKMLQKGIITND